ncbi:acyltransferase family protein [Stenotrophomonas maltophilia]|uniref:acyltransferase family protein n=1 Tax=Stenotrophomonas maltophilia TaxID=40324 RepID=UPI0013DAAAB3|nr:acyltransferase [Stenotrophomonas maltophilia]
MALAEKLLPNPDKNIPFLDAVRGIAVLFVLVRHAWGLSWSPSASIAGIELSRIIVMMSSGVDLFFVLSGVLLSTRFLRADANGKPAPEYLPYIKARILRIGPPYWLVLFLVVLFYTPVFIPQEKVWSTAGAAIFISHLAFGQSLFLFSFGAYSVGTPFWTLTIEMLFYLVLPLVVRAFYRGRWWQGILAAFLLSSVWLYLCRYHLDGLVDFLQRHTFGLGWSSEGVRFFLSHQILGYLPHFAIGIGISALLLKPRTHPLLTETAGLLYALLGAALLLALMFKLGGLSLAYGFQDPTAYFRTDDGAARLFYYFESMPFAVAYGLIILGLSLGSSMLKRSFASIPGLALFGVLGYSIYLIHMPLLYTMNNHYWIAAETHPWWHLAKFLTAGTGVILLLSLILFLTVEKPSMIWSARASQRVRTPPRPSATGH